MKALQKTCLICEKIFFPTRYKRGRETPSNFARRKVCSVQCGYQSMGQKIHQQHARNRRDKWVGLKP
jgi:hypothetical protein